VTRSLHGDLFKSATVRTPIYVTAIERDQCLFGSSRQAVLVSGMVNIVGCAEPWVLEGETISQLLATTMLATLQIRR
jgi:hypothetical protein